ncbi:MAG: hypothetical protein IJ852_04755, partial [Alphaproteobacteria bacterium]|nr:hypothetical protein [Alphaproteobacteria bacterium]
TTLFNNRLLSLCAGDAPTFLSAVYNRGTQAKKRQADVPQCGRSMIEMLGVLAIIGVLTVGSITGYSHAMRRHLLNKQREQISTILATIETQYGALSASMSDIQAGGNTHVFKNLGWIPEDMIREDNTFVYDIFKNRAIFWINRYTTSTFLGFYIYLNNGNAFEQCVNLYQTAMSFHSSLWMLNIHHDDGGTGGKNGDRNCLVNNPSCLRNSTPSDIAKICQKCKDNNRCNIYYFWHFER